MNAKLRRFGSRTAVIALAVVVAIGGLRMLRRVFLPLPLDRCTERRFDAARWQDRTQVFTASAPRGCMVDDLLRRHELAGQPRAAAVRLLGEPDSTPYFREYDLVYWLGPERGLISIDSEWLVMRLDSAGRVAEHRLVTD